MDPVVKREILRLRAAGESWRSVAAALNAKGVPTATGKGRWHASTVLRGMDGTAWAAYMREYRRGHGR